MATCCSLAGGAMAQVGFSPFSQSVGTYTPITGTQLTSNMTSSTGTASLDGGLNLALAFPGGFSFTYDGTAYTDCRVSADGNITFGATTTNSTAPLSSGTAWNGVIAAAARDLQGGYKFTSNRTATSTTVQVVNADFAGITVGSFISGSGIPAGATVASVDEMGGTFELSTPATTTATGVVAHVWNGRINYELLGVAPNRTLVIQWSNFSPAGTTLTTVNGARWNFQIRLNETSNSIDVVYGDCDPGVGTTITTAYQVGLRGPNNTFPANVNNRSVVKGTNDWATSNPGTANNSSCIFNDVAPSNVIPSGLTFHWDAPPALNVSAGIVQRTGTGCFGAAEALTARIANSGTGTIDLTTNPVSISVSIGGAGTGTLTGTANTGTLAPGATQDVALTPTADMSASGTYTFATTVTMTGDELATDDLFNSQIDNPAATLPQTVDFTGFTGTNLSALFPGWYEATGATVPTGTTSGLVQSSATQETAWAGNRTIRYNFWNAGDVLWVVSPRTEPLPATAIFSFKVAATNWNNSGDDADFMNEATVRDDRIVIRVSTDCGASFTDVYRSTRPTGLPP
ncbi:MAG: hypothetical protein H6590_03150 [Flavobacteriales bacterium]|nr:hypothetical protein [Flavobacteriales bacterium]